MHYFRSALQSDVCLPVRIFISCHWRYQRRGVQKYSEESYCIAGCRPSVLCVTIETWPMTEYAGTLDPRWAGISGSLDGMDQRMGNTVPTSQTFAQYCAYVAIEGFPRATGLLLGFLGALLSGSRLGLRDSGSRHVTLSHPHISI